MRKYWIENYSALGGPRSNYTDLVIKVGWCSWCPCKTHQNTLLYGPISFAGCSLLITNSYCCHTQTISEKSITKSTRSLPHSCGTYHWDPRESLASQPMTCDSCGPSVLREIASCCRTRNRWPQFGDMSWILHLDIMTWQIGMINHSRCSWTIQSQQGKIACEMNICNICKNMSQQQAMLKLETTRSSGIHSKVGLTDGLEIRGGCGSPSTAWKNIFRWKSPYKINRNHTKSTWLLYLNSTFWFTVTHII